MKVNAKALLFARAKACITTDELAKKSGVGRNTILRIESNKTNPRPVIVGRLAKALEISVESLYLEEK